jgi:hypothetical protein
VVRLGDGVGYSDCSGQAATLSRHRAGSHVLFGKPCAALDVAPPDEPPERTSDTARGSRAHRFRVRRGDLQGVLAAEGRIAPWGPHVGPLLSSSGCSIFFQWAKQSEAIQHDEDRAAFVPYNTDGQRQAVQQVHHYQNGDDGTGEGQVLTHDSLCLAR